MSKKVAVMVVDDSPLCRQVICDSLKRDPDLEVVATCENGAEAVSQAQKLRPNVITMDIEMPVMDGLTAVESIMAENPIPILVLTADLQHQAPALTGRALELGALGLMVKPAMDAGPEAWDLAREVKLLSSVKVIRHHKANKVAKPAGRTEAAAESPFTNSTIGLVAIAASTGGPQVVHKLLAELPGNFPAPIVIVQHINAAFAGSLAGWLASSCKLKVRLAAEGDSLVPGEVLIAPPGKHLVIPSRGRVSLRNGEPREGHLPSGSSLLESAANAYGKRAVGIILTGMGSDGADGMSAIKAAGGTTLAQSEDSCIVFGMPAAAIAKGAVDHVVHGDEMAQALLRLARGEALPPSR